MPSPALTHTLCRRAIVPLVGLIGTAAWVNSATESSTSGANQAKNLARMNCGAHITWFSSEGSRDLTPSTAARVGESATDLLLDDNTLNCQVAGGENTFLVTLPNISNLNRLSFINEKSEATGYLQVFVSNYRLGPNDYGWNRVGRGYSFSHQRFVSLALPAVEAKYVKISFQVDKPGAIAGLGLYGEQTLSSFADQRRRGTAAAATFAYSAMTLPSQNNLNFNLANLYARAKVVAVSSGRADQVSRMIDDDPSTEFNFAPNDPHPTVVVELAVDQRLRRISAIYDTKPGRLDIFLLNSLPGPGTLDNTKPVVSLTDADGSGKAAAEFEPRGAHYVCLRWTPADKSRRTGTFSIAEIGAFSDTTPAMIDIQGIPEQFARTSSIVTLPPMMDPPRVAPASE